jgi:hypothetical protein
MEARCRRSGRFSNTEYGTGFWLPSRRSLPIFSMCDSRHQDMLIHSNVHAKLRQVQRRCKVEGFHRERCCSFVLSYAMGMRHSLDVENHESLLPHGRKSIMSDHAGVDRGNPGGHSFHSLNGRAGIHRYAVERSHVKNAWPTRCVALTSNNL